MNHLIQDENGNARPAYIQVRRIVEISTGNIYETTQLDTPEGFREAPELAFVEPSPEVVGGLQEKSVCFETHIWARPVANDNIDQPRGIWTGFKDRDEFVRHCFGYCLGKFEIKEIITIKKKEDSAND